MKAIALPHHATPSYKMDKTKFWLHSAAVIFALISLGLLVSPLISIAALIAGIVMVFSGWSIGGGILIALSAVIYFSRPYI